MIISIGIIMCICILTLLKISDGLHELRYRWMSISEIASFLFLNFGIIMLFFTVKKHEKVEIPKMKSLQSLLNEK